MKRPLAVGYVRSYDPDSQNHDEWTARVEYHAVTYSLDLRKIYRDDVPLSTQGPQRPGFASVIRDLSLGTASVVIVPAAYHLSFDRETCRTLVAAIACAGGVLHIIRSPTTGPTVPNPRTETLQ